MPSHCPDNWLHAIYTDNFKEKKFSDFEAGNVRGIRVSKQFLTLYVQKLRCQSKLRKFPGRIQNENNLHVTNMSATLSFNK